MQCSFSNGRMVFFKCVYVGGGGGGGMMGFLLFFLGRPMNKPPSLVVFITVVPMSSFRSLMKVVSN